MLKPVGNFSKKAIRLPSKYSYLRSNKKLPMLYPIQFINF